MPSADGTVAFEAAGKPYRMRASINALCMIEDRLGKGSLAIATELEFDPRIATIRTIFWATLNDPDLTLTQAGEIIEALGLKEAVRFARAAFQAAFPEAEPAQDGADPRPPVAVAG